MVDIYGIPQNLSANSNLFPKTDQHDLFVCEQIHRSGELFVNKELDREMMAHYTLTVAATDGAFVSFTLVKVDVLDDNDNAPTCDQVCIERIFEKTKLAFTVRMYSLYQQNVLINRIIYLFH